MFLHGLKVSIGKLAVHCLITYVSLLLPSDAPGSLSGTKEPVHQMDAMNIAVLSCNDHSRSSSLGPIICVSSGCWVKDIFICIYRMENGEL